MFEFNVVLDDVSVEVEPVFEFARGFDDIHVHLAERPRYLGGISESML